MTYQNPMPPPAGFGSPPPPSQRPAQPRTSLPERWAWVRPFVLRALVGSLIASALVGAVSALVGQFGPLSWRVLSTIIMFVVVSLLIWYDAEVSARRSDGFGVASLVISGVLVVVGLVEIWWPRELVVDGRVHGIGTWLVVVLIARIALLHIHLLLNVYRRFPTPGMRGLARVTFGLVAVLALLLAVTLVADFVVPEGYWRVVAAVAILDGTGTILIPLVHTLFYKERMAPPARPPSSGQGGYGPGQYTVQPGQVPPPYAGAGRFPVPPGGYPPQTYGGRPPVPSVPAPVMTLPRLPDPDGSAGSAGPPAPAPAIAPTVPTPTVPTPMVPTPMVPPMAPTPPVPTSSAAGTVPAAAPTARPGPPPGGLGGGPARFVYAPPSPAVMPPPAPVPVRLEWPRYEDGRPLPIQADGTPDFTGVALR